LHKPASGVRKDTEVEPCSKIGGLAAHFPFLTMPYSKQSEIFLNNGYNFEHSSMHIVWNGKEITFWREFR
jgi:hypothetical protein